MAIIQSCHQRHHEPPQHCAGGGERDGVGGEGAGGCGWGEGRVEAWGRGLGVQGGGARGQGGAAIVGNHTSWPCEIALHLPPSLPSPSFSPLTVNPEPKTPTPAS